MTTETDAVTPSLWGHVRTYRFVIAALTGVCLAVSLLLTWVLHTPVHTAEARLAVGSGQMTALNIPGYPTASEAMASNYARWVHHQGVQGQLAPEGTLSLTASPIVESNVLRIEATSEDPEVAVRAADEAADALREAVNQVADFNDPESLVAEISDNVAPLLLAREAVQRAEVEHDEARAGGASASVADQAFETLIEAQQDLTALELEQDGRRDRYRNLIAAQSTEADLVEVSSAQAMGDDGATVLQRNGLLAVLAGLAVSGGVAWSLERRRTGARRAASDSEVTASL